MGCLVAQSLKQTGAAQVVVTDVVLSRLEMVKKLGIRDTVLGPNAREEIWELNPSGYDIVLDATGIPIVLEGAFEFVRLLDRG